MMLVLWSVHDAKHLICLMHPCSTSAHNACPLYFGLESFRELGQLMLMMLVLRALLVVMRLVHRTREIGQLMLIALVSYSFGFENLGD